MSGTATVWRIVGIAPANGPVDVDLVVGTTDPVVLEAIEKAASNAGIVLERRDPERDE